MDQIGTGADTVQRPICLGEQVAAVHHAGETLKSCHRKLERAWAGKDAAQVKALIKGMAAQCAQLEERLAGIEKLAAAAQDGP